MSCSSIKPGILLVASHSSPSFISPVVLQFSNSRIRSLFGQSAVSIAMKLHASSSQYFGGSKSGSIFQSSSVQVQQSLSCGSHLPGRQFGGMSYPHPHRIKNGLL